MAINFDAEREHAVWDGRFQPFHNGHLEVVRSILAVWPGPLVVMIIQSSSAPGASGHSAVANPHHLPSRNPLTVWERYMMLDLALAHAGIRDRVAVLGIPRPDLYWEVAREFYPTRRVICLTDKDEYERAKVVFWESLGERPVITPVRGVERVSATELKRRIRASEPWDTLLAPGTVEYFRAINGPERFARIEE